MSQHRNATAIVGAGAFGTALACVLARGGREEPNSERGGQARALVGCGVIGIADPKMQH